MREKKEAEVEVRDEVLYKKTNKDATAAKLDTEMESKKHYGNLKKIENKKKFA